jgi:hypothetical protein
MSGSSLLEMKRNNDTITLENQEISVKIISITTNYSKSYFRNVLGVKGIN